MKEGWMPEIHPRVYAGGGSGPGTDVVGPLTRAEGEPAHRKDARNQMAAVNAGRRQPPTHAPKRQGVKESNAKTGKTPNPRGGQNAETMSYRAGGR